MNTLYRMFAGIVAVALLAACTPSARQDRAQDVPQELVWNADVSDAFDTARLRRIDAAFERYVDEGLMPQAAVMVVHRGRVVYRRAFGWRDMEARIACQPTDLFRIASQTKAICVVGLMTLFEEGRFQLDEPVSRYLPAFANPQVLVSYDEKTGLYTTRPAKSEITVRHLITHTSGLCGTGCFEQIARQKGVCLHNTLDSITLAENVDRMGSLPLAHDPGEQFTYSVNVDVLGRLCEVISGQPVDSFLSERVLMPLGMEDTYFDIPADKADRLVQLYDYPAGGPLRLSADQTSRDYPIAGARMLHSTGGGMSGTIDDYARFCQMILNGGEFNHHRILGRKTLEMMQKNGVGDLRGAIGFGMAWDVFTPQNAHNTIISEGSMRWGGMFGTDYVIDPAENLILLMYTNMGENRTGVSPKTLLHNVAYQALK